ncbi:MAG TPA: FHA domain-containing protein [Candidatus Paceibacterota bacterium]|nr:FHA domain-containing protein [Candidatus Paceibacterota bacterium]
MNRLVVNPGTPQSWEIQLKPGTNSIGRSDQNDFQVSDGSVSGTHCQVIVTDETVTLIDLGSTNGTFVNQRRIQQTNLENGQPLRLGSVEMVFQGEAAPVAAPAASRPANSHAGSASIRVNLHPTASKPAGLRISGTAPADGAVAVEEAPPAPPPLVPDVPAGPRFCKFHPRSPARFLCRKCNRTFCDLCVSSRQTPNGTVKTCRSCGVECMPLHVDRATAPVHRGFFRQIPGAFIYPFKGTGLLVLIAATIVFAALSFMGRGIFGIILKMAVIGYFFSYMQNIIHATASEEQQMPELPEFDGLFGAFFTLLGTIVMSFGLAIGLAIAKFFGDVEAIPMAAIMAAVVFGCLYFPMAFLATAMKDTAVAANPLIVLPAIARVPGEYVLTVILMAGVFGVQKLGDIISSETTGTLFTTRSVSVVLMTMGFQMIWSVISLYLLTVNMRILGLLYVTKKEKFGWF